MSTVDLLTLVRDTLAIDAAIVEFCTTSIDRHHTVLLDIDEEHPPAQDLYPVVAVTGLTRSGALSANRVDFELGVGCALLCPEIDEDGFTRTHRGFLHAARLSELVEEALFRALRPLFPGLSFTTETGFANHHPLYGSHTTLTAEEPRSSRAPRFR